MNVGGTGNFYVNGEQGNGTMTITKSSTGQSPPARPARSRCHRCGEPRRPFRFCRT